MTRGARFAADWFLPLLLLPLVWSCASPHPPAPAPRYAGYRYENERLGVALSLPESWHGFASRAEAPVGFEELMPSLKGRDASPLLVGVNGSGQAFVRLLVEAIPAGMNAREYFGRLHLALGSGVETLAVAEAVERDTIRWRYRVRQGALDLTFVELVTTAGEHAFRLGFWSMAALVERHGAEFSGIADDLLVHRGDAWEAPWLGVERWLDPSAYAHMEFAADTGPHGPPVCAIGERALLWRVATPRSTLHLFGSIHFGHPDFYPFDEPIEAAFAESDALVVELDFSAPGFDAEMAEATNLLLLPAGTTLDDVVSAELYERTVAVLDSLGLAPTDLEQLGPALLGTTLVVLKALSLGYDGESGVDRYFLQRAGDREIIALETPAEQMGMLAGFDGEQVLADTLPAIEQMGDESQTLVAAWRCGDADVLETALLGDGADVTPAAEQMRQAMFSDRNVRMTRMLVELLDRGGTYFVVTGAGHMVGADGIPALLEAEGYSVEER